MRRRLQDLWDDLGAWLVIHLWPRVFTDIEAKGFEEGEEWAIMARGEPVGPEGIAKLYSLAEPQEGSQWGIGSGNA